MLEIDVPCRSRDELRGCSDYKSGYKKEFPKMIVSQHIWYRSSYYRIISI